MAQFFKRTKTTVYHNNYFISCLIKYRLLSLRKIDKSHSDWGICFLTNICEHRYDFLYCIYLWFAQKDHRLPITPITWSSSVHQFCFIWSLYWVTITNILQFTAQTPQIFVSNFAFDGIVPALFLLTWRNPVTLTKFTVWLCKMIYFYYYY